MALPAVAALTSPCLQVSSTWDEYEAWPYLFILLAVLATQLVDALIHGYIARRQAAAGAAQGSGARLASVGCPHAALVGAAALTVPSSLAPHSKGEHNDKQQQDGMDAEAGEAMEQGGALEHANVRIAWGPGVGWHGGQACASRWASLVGSASTLDATACTYLHTSGGMPAQLLRTALVR